MKKSSTTSVILLLISITIIFSINASTPWFESTSYPNSRFYEVWISLDSVKISLGKPSININSDSWKKIDIASQEDFNNVNSSITNAIEKGYSNIRIDFQPGKYEYEENHIHINGNHPGLNIIIDGKGSELVSKRIKAEGKKNPRYAYSYDNIPKDFWSETFQLTDSIISTNDSNIYKFKIPTEADIESGDLIKISQWFVTGVYEVNKIDDGHVYFSIDYSFPYNRQNWNVNYDLKYGKTMPRFRLFKTSPDESLSQHTSICFLMVQNSTFQSLSINNINFFGSAQIIHKGVITLINTNSSFTDICNCSFMECKSPCIILNDTENIQIKECSFTDNYNNCIRTDNQCLNTVIVDNYFHNNARDWYNFFDVTISGNGFLVKANTFVNSPYGAIRVGDWWGSQNIRTVKGIVENNLLYYTPDFYNDYWKHTLMDSGAIYISTINNDVHIRYNRIYNIVGMKDYRGIFGDDGTCNSKIYGNIITGIKDNYSIALRYAPNIEEKVNYRFGKVNMGNIMMYNIVDGDILFQGRIGENGCIKGPNFLLQSQYHKTPRLKIKNIYDQEKDILLDAKQTDNELIALSKSDKNRLKQNPIYKKIAKWIK